MPVIKKASTAGTVVLKKTTTAKKVSSLRPVSSFEDLNDVNISSPQDGHVLVYDSTTNGFVLVDPDEILSQSVADNDLPDEFITQLEDELDLGQIQVETLDGGGF